MRHALAILAIGLYAGAQEDWDPMPGISLRPDTWQTQGVALEAEGERLVGRHREASNGVALPRASRFRRELSVEATVAMRQRLIRDGWNFAGVTLYQDSSNFWMLALVEGPDGKHGVDFIECHDGTWQAQGAPGKALEKIGSASHEWRAGESYRLRLVCSADRVMATVSDATGERVLAQGAYVLAKGAAVRGGMPGLILRGSEAAFAAVQARAPREARTATGVQTMDGPLGRIALFDDEVPGADREANRLLADALVARGFGVTRLSAEQMVVPDLLSALRFHMVAIPNCVSFPAGAFEAVMQFAREGGHVLFVGGPFLDNPLIRVGGQWVDGAGIERLLRDTGIAHRPFAIAPDLDLSGWARTCRDRESASQFRVVNEGPGGSACLRLDVDEFGGWDGQLSPALEGLFGPGDDLFLLVGKGDERTPQLAVEIQETDGSRWIATARLSPDWQQIALRLADFRYWHDSRTKNTRGQAGDRLNPAQAARINVGFASSHTPAVGGGSHTVWIADLGSARNPVGTNGGSVLPTSTIPTIYPRYKVHSLAGPAELSAVSLAEQIGPAPTALGLSDSLLCGIPRTLGSGFGRDHKWRFVPLVAATAADGSGRTGFCEWLTLYRELPFAGVAFAGFGYTDPAQWRHPDFLSRVAGVAALLREGAILEEAGPRHLAYWPGEDIGIGARMHAFGTVLEAQLDLEIREDGKAVWQRSERLRIEAGSSGFECSWRPPAEPTTYTFRATLRRAATNAVLDRIEHEFAVLDPALAPQSEFLTVREGDFWLRGEKWYPVGINYWPLYVSGMDHGDYSAGWLRDRYYEPNLVEQDLAHMADMGLNMVSVQSPPLAYHRNLLDFSRRCARHGIRINLYCGLASPLAFDESALREYLETTRLPGNATVFAYDTVWEPGNYVFRDDGARGKWDAEWRAWIDERYGSVANAEADWQYQARRNADGEVVSPPDRCFREDGPWRGMMAAYRRFMDNHTSRLWGRAHRRLRELDPNHLVSYRQGNTLPHDFALTGTNRHIDFICPEGYAVPHSDTGENAIGFITRYVDYTTGGKPIIWSEFGKSVWDGQRMASDATAIQMVGEYHARFYRAGLAAGANGTAPWWWPGGYRVGERSDFGIVGPDRSERPAARLIREYAPRFRQPRPRPVPTAWFDYDRDAHAGGYCRASFHEGAEAYAAAARQGRVLGIRSAGTGTNSTNTPLIAVGNTRCNGSNPPKYLDGEFDYLYIRNADGRWVDALDGTTIRVRAVRPVRARASLGNLQEATWAVPGDLAGGVALVVRAAGRELARVPISRPVPHLGTADFGEFVLLPGPPGDGAVSVRLEALGRTPFGEARSFVLEPVR